MSASGILSSSFANYSSQALSHRLQFQQDFKQLGQDLQSGNLSAAQSEFATLQKVNPQSSSTSSAQNTSLTQEINQLSQDLQSGNLSAAQKDIETIQTTVKGNSVHMHHHHRGTAATSQLMSELGQALEAGNLDMAQQAYSTLAQDLPQYSQVNGQVPAEPSQSGASGVSVTA